LSQNRALQSRVSNTLHKKEAAAAATDDDDDEDYANKKNLTNGLSLKNTPL
jgi:hypothetical protein